MRFLFFTKGGKVIASSRYRAYYVAEALERMGHTALVMPAHELSFVSALRQLLSKSNVIFLQRTIYSRKFIVAVFIAWLFGKRYIFDIDDAVYAPPAKRTEFLAFFASLITCGSSYLLAWAERRGKAVYFPNGVPIELYTKRDKAPEGIPIIGWVGTGNTQLENLSLLPPILKRLQNFHFVLIGANGDQRIHKMFEGIPATIIDSLNWADPTELIKEIKKFTIGVAPLANTPGNQTLHFKVLEYMACGLPVVASPRSAIKEIVESSHCGFLADTEDEWVRNLENLLSNKELRVSEGQKGRNAVEETYTSEKMAERLVALARETYKHIRN
jgi:glycosyltransferase involved in cell wall biosynthesis